MRILFTMLNFPPSNFGGISSCMYPVIKELGYEKNIEVKILTTNYKISKNISINTNCWTLFNGISVNYIKAKNPYFSLNYIIEGFRQIKKNDQVYLNSLFFFPTLLFLIISVIYGKKIYLTPHGELFDFALKNKFWKKAPYLMFVKFFSRRVSFIATSDQEALAIKYHFSKSKVIIITNFFELQVPLNMKKLNKLIFLGRICNIKKIENLIIACSISKYFLSKKYKFLIAGPTDDEYLKYDTMLRKLVVTFNLEKNIKFLGELNSPQKEELLSQSKALFVVSESENFSNVVVESIAQGTPVVASKGTPWTALVDRNAGFWIDNSPELIAQKMDEIILMDNDKYEIMCENSISFSKEFSKLKILPKWLETIKNNYV